MEYHLHLCKIKIKYLGVSLTKYVEHIRRKLQNTDEINQRLK